MHENTTKFIRCPSSEQTVITLGALSLQHKNTVDCALILNCQQNQYWLDVAMQCCEHVILADGGANFVYKSKHRDSQKILCIIGDLDSLEEKVKEYYAKTKVQIIKVQDQTYNDFEKSINKALSLNFHSCLCVGALGNRLDHTLSAMSISSKFGQSHPELKLILIGSGNMMFHIKPKIQYEIRVSKQVIQMGGCGLITFGKAEHVQNDGFKWNMGSNYQFKSMEWGNFLSTSNQIVKDIVKVKTSHSIFFVAQLACIYPRQINRGNL